MYSHQSRPSDVVNQYSIQHKSIFKLSRSSCDYLFLERHGVVVAILYRRTIGLSHDNLIIFHASKHKMPVYFCGFYNVASVADWITNIRHYIIIIWAMACMSIIIFTLIIVNTSHHSD